MEINTAWVADSKTQGMEGGWEGEVSWQARISK